RPTDCQPAPVEIGLHAMTGDGLKLSHLWDGDPPLSGACDDRLGDWVLGVLLDAGGKLQSLALFDSRSRMRRDDAMFSERERGCLVEYHRVKQARFLEAPTVANEESVPGGQSRRDRDDQWHRKSKCMGTCNHQNRDKSLDSVGWLGADGQPSNE